MKHHGGGIMIRSATKDDIPVIMNLLEQVAAIHHHMRPDIFKPAAAKYTVAELEQILSNKKTPVFVYTDAENTVRGYAFCAVKEHKNETLLADSKSVYIDDLCVDENCRGKHIGVALYAYVKNFAKSIGANSITLNVWEGNAGAKAFYEHLGMRVQRTTMEDKF